MNDLEFIPDLIVGCFNFVVFLCSMFWMTESSRRKEIGLTLFFIFAAIVNLIFAILNLTQFFGG